MAKIRKNIFFWIALLGSIFLAAPQAQAVKPVYSNFSLVAGEEGEQGYRDGEFYQAIFNHPSGLALSPDEKLLYVADSQNNCLRVIHLDKDNWVSTLAGSIQAGYKDGPVSQALFKKPSTLAVISPNKLLVYDQGNSALRLINLEKNIVTTLAGGNGSTNIIRDKSFISAPMGGIWDMEYVASENSIYISQPGNGCLQKLNLNTKQTSFVLKGDPRVPAPGSFRFSNGLLFVADQRTSAIYRIPMGPGDLPGNPVTISSAEQIYQIASMQDCGGTVYAIPFKSDQILKLDKSIEPINMISAWGQTLNNPVTPFWFLRSNEEKVSLQSILSRDRRFYLANPSTGSIYQFADYGYEKYKSSMTDSPNWLRDFDYPTKKAPGTYRILLVGISYLFYDVSYDGKVWVNDANRMETFPKKLEQTLNAWAALEDVPVHFEVLVKAHELGDDWPDILWPYYLVPDIVKNFDVDQVMYVAVPSNSEGFRAFYNRPLSPEGIPVSQIDPEYLLKPYSEKSIQGTPEKLFKLCQEKKLADFTSNGQVVFNSFINLLGDPEIRSVMEELYVKLFGSLSQKIKKMKTLDQKPVDFRVCFLPLSTQPVERFEDFWSQVCRMGNIPFLDLKAQVFTLKASFYPLTEEEHEHFTVNGHLFVAQILAHELIKQGLIPWKAAQ
jgi:hypothetical protein